MDLVIEQWEEIKQIFGAMLECEPEARAALLSERCAEESGLRAQVEYLLHQHEHAGSFLEGGGPVTQKRLPFWRTFSEGQTVAGRFRIERFLGEGGMGEVYEVSDLLLGDRAALKTILPKSAHDPRYLARFRNEIQLARKVTHPNVCRVFDVASETTNRGEITFLTMELLQGETLAQRIRRDGRIDSAEARLLWEQILAGLEAAHRAGVLHRDLKPANIMLVPAIAGQTRVVLTDFGLARSVEKRADESSLTEAGHILGTLAYLSPEQIEGREATPASDIYSLGVVVYEMVTGQKPFEEASPLASVAKRLKGAPPSPRTIVAGLDATIEAAILRCLQPRPEDRFASARNVAFALTALPPKRPSPNPRFVAWVRSLQLRWVLVSLAVAIALFFAFSRLYFRRPLIEAGASMMMLGMENRTQDPNLDGVSELLRSQLGQSPYFSLWDQSRLPGVLQRMAKPVQRVIDADLAREIAAREGVPFLLFSGVSPLADSLVLNLRLERIGRGTMFSQRVWSYSTHASGRRDLYDAVHQASHWLRRTVGESAEDLSRWDRLPQDTTTNSWEALSAFAKAERYQTESKPENAVLMLRQAVALDPQFALAQMRLGDILMSLNRQEEARTAWRSTLTEAGRRHLTRREELRLRGVYAGDANDYAGAEAAFTEMIEEYPHDFLALFYLGDTLRWQGRVEQALKRFRQAETLRPNSFPLHANLATVCLFAHRIEEAATEVRRLGEIGRPDVADHYLGLIQFVRSEYPEAGASFDREVKSADPSARSRGYSARAALLAELGQKQRAIELLERGAEEDLQAGKPGARVHKLLSAAYLYAGQGRKDLLGIACTKALRDDSSAMTLMRAGTLYARAGVLAEARALKKRLDALDDSTPRALLAKYRLEGELLLAMEYPAQAVERFRRADKLDARLCHREYLARALAATGEYGEALTLYQRLVDSPELLAHIIDFDFPGTLTDSLPRVTALARRFGQDELASRASHLYELRRPSLDSAMQPTNSNKQEMEKLK